MYVSNKINFNAKVRIRSFELYSEQDFWNPAEGRRFFNHRGHREHRENV